jgi:MoaA/NifB/PqqE/SkfB family radical SAM enzyme
MFQFSDYGTRGYNLIHNHLMPQSKRLSSLMLYATDLCDSGCKHCLIWAKRPTTVLPFETIERIMKSKCVHPSTMVGLEGGEFLLHPEADKILDWFARHHRNYDLFSNCLKPDALIDAVKKYKPHRLYISLDGDKDTYLHMRGKDGYEQVIRVIRELKGVVPVFVMFTLSPYNDFDDLRHVAAVCRENNVFLRVGIYNNIPFFDTIESAPDSYFGQCKNDEVLTFSKAKALQKKKEAEVHGPGNGIEAAEGREAGEAAMGYGVPAAGEGRGAGAGPMADYAALIPPELQEHAENDGYVKLYRNWVTGDLRLKCRSILDSVIVLPDGDVPVCQHLNTRLGNIYKQSLDEIFNSAASNKVQQHYSENCNQCWVSYHRKYDIILYRTMEKYFGKWATGKLLGYYKWDADDSLTYKEVVG